MDRSPSPESPSGFRLLHLQVYNWGTFDSTNGQVHSLVADGKTTLLVGQNGSGKSTLVDGLLTLLVPTVVRNYNVAAGAKKTERSEQSYLRGAFGHQGTGTGGWKTQYLRRGGKHFTVLLAAFGDASQGKAFTLCQYMYENAEGTLTKLYAWTDSNHNLRDDLVGLQTSASIAGHLKNLGYTHSRRYADYANWLQRRTAMLPKAMDVFNQTVAVKDIQSLNEFIRRHVLEATGARQRVEQLLEHFGELTATYRQLEQARQAQSLLEPLEALSQKHQSLRNQVEQRQQTLRLLPWFFAKRVGVLGRPLLKDLGNQLKAIEQQRIQAQREYDALRLQWAELKSKQNRPSESQHEAILQQLYQSQQHLLEVKQRARQSVIEDLQRCGLSTAVDTSKELKQTRQAAEKKLSQISNQLLEVRQLRDQWLVKKREAHRELEQRKEQLAGTNEGQTMPADLQALRDALARQLRIEAAELPFVAEIVSVRSKDAQWLTQIERVLAPLPQTLLVHRRLATRFVQALQKRKDALPWGTVKELSYLVVEPTAVVARFAASVSPQSLLRKLQFETNHPFCGALQTWLLESEPGVCLEEMHDQGEDAQKIVTSDGFIAWNDQQFTFLNPTACPEGHGSLLAGKKKVTKKLLAVSLTEAEHELEACTQRLANLDGQVRELREQESAAQRVLQITDFSAIDIAACQQQLQRLGEQGFGGDIERDLQKHVEEQLQQVEAALATADQQRRSLALAEGELRQQENAIQGWLEESRASQQEHRPSGTVTDREGAVAELERLAAADQRSSTPLQPNDIARKEMALQQTVTTKVQTAWQELSAALEPIERQLLGAMNRYLREFPQQQTDVDADLRSLPTFLSILQQVREEDLPRYQQRFKQRLTETVDQELALFYASLRNEAQQIESRIDELNSALGTLDYESGTVMTLEAKEVDDREIARFQKLLRACVETKVENQTEGAESKYRQVEKLIEKLADDQQARWREKVIDVRRWYDFVAHEVDRSSGNRLRSYQDSSGQSGGEKAKLAFTILVAGIAHQYGLTGAGTKAGKFHFVCVDEMFSKVDDRYAEYALRLFEQVGLQLLIVAPLDAKARITESHVKHYAHVVKNSRSHHSQIFNMSAGEYETVANAFVEFGPTGLLADNENVDARKPRPK